MTKPMDRKLEHHFSISLFRCVAKYLPAWDEIEIEASTGGQLHCRFLCGPNLTLTQVQEYAAQKIVGELIHQLSIAKGYAEDRWGKK